MSILAQGGAEKRRRLAPDDAALYVPPPPSLPPFLPSSLPLSFSSSPSERAQASRFPSLPPSLPASIPIFFIVWATTGISFRASLLSLCPYRPLLLFPPPLLPLGLPHSVTQTLP